MQETYGEMLKEMVEYALEHGASQSALHEVFYEVQGALPPAPHEGRQGRL